MRLEIFLTFSLGFGVFKAHFLIKNFLIKKRLICSVKLKDVFFRKLDHRVIFDNKKFCKTVAPLFWEKSFHKKSIILNNNNKTICNNEELPKIFNKHFSKLVNFSNLVNNIKSSDTKPVFSAIEKNENHPSTKHIKNVMSGKDLKFSFIFETTNKILAEIHNLDKKKACQESDISVKKIKDNIGIFSEFVVHTSIIRYLMQLSLQN